MVESAIRTALLGFGYWGPKLASNIQRHHAFELSAIADINVENLRSALIEFPNVRTHNESLRLLRDQEIDAVVISTPACTHFELCESALRNGKHVIVTKPFTMEVIQARELAQMASEIGVVVLVDHTFLYSSAISAIKAILRRGDLGRILYYESTRSGLGIFKDDADVIDDLAIHDLYIVNHLFGDRFDAITAQCFNHLEATNPSASYITLIQNGGITAHITSHWLSPLRQRQIVIVGEKKMLVWDDTLENEKVAIFDRGLDWPQGESVREAATATYRDNGKVVIPVDGKEPLEAELDDFQAAIETSKPPVSDAASAIQVLEIASAAKESARSDSKIAMR